MQDYITETEFAYFIELYSRFWNVTFEKPQAQEWYDKLKPLKIKGLSTTLKSLSSKGSAPPSIKMIIDEYVLQKREQEAALRERQAEQRRQRQQIIRVAK